MTIIGYDYISFNDSIKYDIFYRITNEDDSIKKCIYSHSLIDFNWWEYINEGNIVLEYNGKIIISESIERYEIIKIYLEELKMKIIIDDYIEIIFLSKEKLLNKTNHLFILHAIKL